MISIEHSHSWEKVWMLAKTDFKLRYHGSVLGIVWVLLKPLAIFAVLSFVFSHVFKNTASYSLNLLTGLVFWNFFAEGSMVGLTSLLSKAHIITKIFVPKWIIIVASTLNTCFSFLMSVGVLAIFCLLNGVILSAFAWLQLFFYALITYLLILSISFFLSPLYLRFRDINQIWEVFLLAAFYGTPIIYPINVLSSPTQAWLYLNPMTFVIQHAQAVVVGNANILGGQDVLYVLLILVIVVVSFWSFVGITKRSAEHV